MLWHDHNKKTCFNQQSIYYNKIVYIYIYVLFVYHVMVYYLHYNGIINYYKLFFKILKKKILF